MRQIVLIKQVPTVGDLAFDPATRTLKRDGVRLEVSAFDVRALLRAIELRAEAGGEVVAMTMGPPQARDALAYCLALGADRAVHLVDPAFAGADTLATARALAAALRREGFDLVLAGRASVDAETGQVGPEVAELLDLPQVTCVRRLGLDAGATRLTAERETDAGFETVACDLPALVTAAEDLAPERFPRKADREAATGRPIVEVRAADLGLDPGTVGVAGSPTWVAGLEAVDVARAGEVVEGDGPEAVRAVVDRLAARGALGPTRGADGMAWAAAAGVGNAPGGEPGAASPKATRREGGHASGPAHSPVTDAADGREAGDPRSSAPAGRAPGDPARAIWVVAETLDGAVRRVTAELLGKARELAGASGGEVVAVLLGDGVGGQARALGRAGADRVLVVEHPVLGSYVTEPYAHVLADLVRARGPAAVLLPSTVIGRDLAPRVAARLGLGLTGDCIDLGLDPEGRLVQWKPAFGGNVVAPILSRTRPAMATIRPGLLAPAPPRADDAAVIEEIALDAPRASRVQILDRRPAPGVERAAALDEAEVAIGVGIGVGGPEALEEIEAIAAILGTSALAATRDVTDKDWLPRQHQVGLTGRAIAPRLYLAIGIRGAFEHMVGLRRAGTIVAINRNAKAPIFKQADVGLVADWRVVLRPLAEEIRRRGLGAGGA